MRKLTFVLMAVAGFALVAGAGAAPASAEVRINIGPPAYYVPPPPPPPYYSPYYGYNQPYYYAPPPGPRVNIYVDPYGHRYHRHHFPGYYHGY